MPLAHPWHDLPNNPEEAERGFNVVIEIGVDVKVIIRCVGVVRVGLVIKAIIGLFRVIAPRII